MPPPAGHAGPSFHTVYVVGLHWLSNQAFELELGCPEGFQFLPGQRVRVAHAGIQRDYSPVSSPAESSLTLCIRRVEGGQLTPRLARLRIGEPLQLAGPMGYFVFRPSSRPAVFVATGTGIAPFVSMARAGATGFHLLHGVRTAAELYYATLFRQRAGRYVPCLAGAENTSPAPAAAFAGRVTQYVAEKLPPGAYDFYLCGRVEVIGGVTRLVDQRFPGSLVYTEAYY
jgi:benzoate/toluate 1,2-dioxygenase reductase subunit